MIPKDLIRLRMECAAELDRIGRWWGCHAERAEGGYHGKVFLDGTPDPAEPVSAILIARILWFFSTLSLFPGKESYRAHADRAAAWFLNVFVDPGHGGVVWSTTPSGEIQDGRKHAYAQAFGLYALAMHHRMSRCRKSLSAAQQIAHLLDERFRDPVHGGYREALSRDWSPLADHRLSEKEPASPKTMNTHLHIVEAFTELARSDRSEPVLAHLRHALGIFLDKIVSPDRETLAMFLTDDWIDESTATSFGHEIEASWLICEAADVLGEDELKVRARSAAIGLAESVLEHGTGQLGQVYDERRKVDGRIECSSVWWVQAEALVGFTNAYEITGDVKYADAALKCWAFIKGHIIAPEGEWRSNALSDGPIEPWWAGPWKACYHNGRAMMEVIRRIDDQS
ncbi:MAG: AGE family epimerase/isomerase [Hyphomonas sp.]